MVSMATENTDTVTEAVVMVTVMAMVTVMVKKMRGITAKRKAPVITESIQVMMRKT